MKLLSRYLTKPYQLSIINCQLVVVMALIAITTISCDGPKIIPEEKLQNIITDILLTEGVRNSGMVIHSDVPLDSVDFYGPVLSKYGYTVSDFSYTINEMASRKSNPLEGVMVKVVATIDRQAAIAQYRYDVARRFDSLALKAYADTVYLMDSTIVGSVKKIRIKIDSVKAGDYRIAMSYQSMLDYRLPQKSIKYYFASKGEKKSLEQVIWLNRNDKMTKASEILSTPKDRDSLIIFFSEAPVTRYVDKSEAPLKDTSVLKDLVVVHTPPVAEARTLYYNSILGGSFRVSTELFKKNEQQSKKDSLPGPIGLSR